MTEEQKFLILRAIHTYGTQHQIVIAMEELCELAAILAKCVRYRDMSTATESLREAVLSEYADVTVMTQSVRSVFNFTDEEIDEVVSAKLARLRRWLDESDDIELTTVSDRREL